MDRTRSDTQLSHPSHRACSLLSPTLSPTQTAFILRLPLKGTKKEITAHHDTSTSSSKISWTFDPSKIKFYSKVATGNLSAAGNDQQQGGGIYLVTRTKGGRQMEGRIIPTPTSRGSITLVDIQVRWPLCLSICTVTTLLVHLPTRIHLGPSAAISVFKAIDQNNTPNMHEKSFLHVLTNDTHSSDILLDVSPPNNGLM